MFGLAFSVDRPNPPGNSSAADGGAIFASPENDVFPANQGDQ
jgi:hypothetical protein